MNIKTSQSITNGKSLRFSQLSLKLTVTDKYFSLNICDNFIPHKNKKSYNNFHWNKWISVKCIEIYELMTADI